MIAVLLLALAVGADPAGAAQAQAPAPVEPAARRAWMESVATEACSPGPVHTPAPIYPDSARRTQRSGRVVLALFINRCGDVRDAWVIESSGHGDIDRTAVHTARSWKAQPPPEGAATATARVAIDFMIEPDA